MSIAPSLFVELILFSARFAWRSFSFSLSLSLAATRQRVPTLLSLRARKEGENKGRRGTGRRAKGCLYLRDACSLGPRCCGAAPAEPLVRSDDSFFHARGRSRALEGSRLGEPAKEERRGQGLISNEKKERHFFVRRRRVVVVAAAIDLVFFFALVLSFSLSRPSDSHSPFPCGESA